MRHVIAAAIYDGLLSFEYSLAREILGRDRRAMVADWYAFRPCRVEDGPLVSSHGFEARPDGTLDELARADTILIAGWKDPSERPPEALLDTLRRAHRRGARLISICTGVFPVAHAGLLDGRRATTHWMHADTLAREHPRVRVERDALYRHDDAGPARISTSAGCAAGLDLCLAVVREDFGVAVANAIARRMVAPVHREGGQSQYADLPDRLEDDQSFGPILSWMNEHLDERQAIEAVSKRFGFSLRTFQRRFKAHTSLSPHQWLVRQRVARARELLESSDRTIEQVATESGLGSAVNLRKHLSRHLGTTPRAYRSTFRADP